MPTNQERKDAIRRWQDHCDNIQRMTIAEQCSEAERQKRIDTVRCNYAKFVAYYFPHYCTDKDTGRNIPAAKFHIQAAELIRRQRDLRAVFQWARGHAKSTHMDIMIPLWLLCQKEPDIHVMVLVGKSESNARTLLGDLQAELQFNQRYIADFGPQYNAGNWQDGQFVTQSGVAFFALGRGQSPRGLRYRESRPDYIVIDDLDDDELCRNEHRVHQITAWVKEALFGTLGAQGGRFVMVGNLIARVSVLSQISASNSVVTSRVNVYDAKGKPSWPEFWTPERIRAKELTSLNEAVAAVAVAVDFYNNRRPHMSIGMAVPADMLHATGERDMRWISYRQRSIKSQSGNDNAEKCLPLLPERGCPSAYGLQSTPLRDKAQQVNPNQE